MHNDVGKIVFHIAFGRRLIQSTSQQSREVALCINGIHKCAKCARRLTSEGKLGIVGRMTVLFDFAYDGFLQGLTA